MSKLPADSYNDLDGETPSSEWEYYAVWEKIRETLYALPSYFRMEGSLPNIPAKDLHSANTLLGAAIEEHIPIALNQLRSTWDPESQYADCLFKRQPQTFPDVAFRRETADGNEVIFGIEIKSWYILAKEMEPSFRMDVNRNFCAPADLAVIYPWAFSAAVSGTPRLFRPLVLGARKAARLRNEFWVSKAKNNEWAQIKEPDQESCYYPAKSDKINDLAPRDSGNNFGRVARTGVWDIAIGRLLREESIAGIPLLGWHGFLSSFKESTTIEQAQVSIARLKKVLEIDNENPLAEALMQIAEALEKIASPGE